MVDICFITTCMGRLDHLRQTLGTWVAQPGASCIVVDYSCPERCGDWVEQTYPQVQVIRVPGKSHFHLAHARNLGAREANAPWLCFIDADIALASSFTEAVLPLLRPGHFYRADPCETGLVGTVLCSRADFAGIDGYDEVIQGWGAEDLDLNARLGLLGLAEAGFPGQLVRSLSHNDELRVKFYDIKRKEISATINKRYLDVKYDLMKLLGQFPSLEMRRHIYLSVGDWVAKAVANAGKRCEIRFNFRELGIPPSGTVQSSLTYSLRM